STRGPPVPGHDLIFISGLRSHTDAMSATQILIGFVAMVTLTGLVGADCGCALGPRGASVCPAVSASIDAWASPSIENDRLVGFSVAMATVPAGQYTVGTDSPQLPSDGESPARLVRFRRPFRLDTAAVTRGQFAQFVRATGHRTDAETAGESFVPDILVDAETFSDPVVVPGRVANAPWWLPVRGATWRRPADSRFRHPAVHVSWRDADAYCRWQGKRAHRGRMGGGLPGRPVRPPVPVGQRAEAGGGRHRMNIWQGEFPRLNTADDGYVDAYGPQNSFGLYNMVGNVWEWTASRWDRNGAPDELPQRPAASDEMTKKGGSFMCHKLLLSLQVRARSQNTADTSSANIGFRCAIDVA
uniref:FGE-sulfatase domain-containing protein n=1 Tax=Macrostomum lignano TaxID=282301 RepID=A0A1I8FH28_9PLAT